MIMAALLAQKDPSRLVSDRLGDNERLAICILKLRREATAQS
jgi:hypothetical protein